MYKVVYSKAMDGVPALYRRDHLVDEWLKENCIHPYYHSPLHLREKYIQFENDKEAVMFALRWL